MYIGVHLVVTQISKSEVFEVLELLDGKTGGI